jgi:uncharacterized protein
MNPILKKNIAVFSGLNYNSHAPTKRGTTDPLLWQSIDGQKKKRESVEKTEISRISAPALCNKLKSTGPASPACRSDSSSGICSKVDALRVDVDVTDKSRILSGQISAGHHFLEVERWLRRLTATIGSLLRSAARRKNMPIIHVLLTALFVAAAFAAPAEAQQVTFMTGPQGGVWVPLGGALKGMWEKAIPGLQVTAIPGAGIANVRGVDEDKAQIGFGNTITTVDGIEGRPPYPKKVTKVCQLANLYPQYFQVVVLANAKINTVADFKGKPIVVQPKGNTAELVTQHILQVHGLSYSQVKASFQASYTDAVDMLKDGHAQAFTLGTTVPASSVMDLASARDIKLIGIDDKILADMKKINPGYSKNTIPANTYPKQEKPLDVIGYATHIVVSCELPEQMVYTMVKTMAANVTDMTAVNKAIAGLTPKMMAEDVGVPFHTGAAKYYKEAKAM